MSIVAVAHPNLALVKYWGKADTGLNLPASGSIGISLGAFSTTTRLRLEAANSGSSTWEVSINGRTQDPERFRDFFDEALKGYSGEPRHIVVASENDFPTAAGLASSASGFAALAGAVNRGLNLNLNDSDISALARRGSGSATRSVFGGFVAYPEKAEYARQLHRENHWPELRCVIVQVSSGKKAVSSRKAMEASRTTSPYYPAWIEDSRKLVDQAREAIADRDLDALGPVIRRSYLRMFSTMFSADDPVMFWQEASIRVMNIAAELRKNGIAAWETMDAGPQVKIITLETQVEAVLTALEAGRSGADDWVISVSGIGSGLKVREE